jgi:hypothetical protein
MDKLSESRVRFIVSIFNYLVFLAAAFVIFTMDTPFRLLLIPVTLLVYLYDAHISYRLGFHHGFESNSFEDRVMNHDAPQALFGENDIVVHYDPNAKYEDEEDDQEGKKSS